MITAICTSLIPLTSFYGEGIFFDGTDSPAVLHAYRRWIASHTERTSSSVALLRLPPDPALPDALRGKFVVHVRMAHIGGSREGARLAAAIRGAAPVLLDTMGEMAVTAMDAVHQDPPGPMPAYEQGCLLDDLTPDTIEAILARTASVPGSPLILVEIRHLGGAIARRPDVPSAVPGRDAAFSLFAMASDVPPPAQAAPAAVAGLMTAVARRGEARSRCPTSSAGAPTPGLSSQPGRPVIASACSRSSSAGIRRTCSGSVTRSSRPGSA